MKSRKLVSSLLLVLFVLFLVFAHVAEGKASVVKNIDNIEDSITFIVGEDESSSNPFYEMAEVFFRHNPEHKTEWVVKNVRILHGVVNYLHHNKPPSGKFWKRVNIVNHSSEYGLKMPLYDAGGKLTTKRWQQFNQSNKVGFPALVAHIDSDTLITLWGCTFGMHEEHLAYLASVFLGVGGRAMIRSPSKRIFFEWSANSQLVKHYYSDEYVLYRSSLTNDSSLLANAFKQLFPSENLEWGNALKREYQGSIEYASYGYKEISIKYHVPLDVIRTFKTLNQFMLSQPEIMENLKARGINLRNLSIEIKASTVPGEILIDCKTVKHYILKRSEVGDSDVMRYAPIKARHNT